jgi:hypothetical protein
MELLSQSVSQLVPIYYVKMGTMASVQNLKHTFLLHTVLATYIIICKYILIQSLVFYFVKNMNTLA